jgi:hypothetical protein
VRRVADRRREKVAGARRLRGVHGERLAGAAVSCTPAIKVRAPLHRQVGLGTTSPFGTMFAGHAKVRAPLLVHLALRNHVRGAREGAGTAPCATGASMRSALLTADSAKLSIEAVKPGKASGRLPGLG